ncbi:MAG: fasciclin domain-containing protein [Myxococcota bacterium]
MAALALGACGDDDGGGGTDSGPGTDSAVETDSATGDDDVIAVAEAAGNFTTLLGAMERVGLTETVRAATALTVFAPTDEAFEALGVDLSTLTDEQLTGILAYHAIGATVRSDAIPATADTLADLTLIFDTSDGVRVNDATVTMADVEASNGVIHVIDRVLMPPDIVAAAGFAGLTDLAGALDTAGLVETLQGAGPFTVFAPTNEAFGELEELPTGDALSQVLTYHVLGSAVLSGAVPGTANSLATNEWDNNLTLFFNTDDGVVINGRINVVTADVRTTNGIVHIVDGVITPLNVAGAAGSAGLTELLGAVGAAGPNPDDTTIVDTLTGDGPLTVFAPTNAAFEEISDTVDGLSPEQIRQVLLYHVITGDAPVLSTDLADGDVATANGQNVTIAVAGPTVNDNAIGPADLHVTNGVVHVVDGVLVPEFP